MRENMVTKVHVSTYGNYTMKPPLQLIYVNKNALKSIVISYITIKNKRK
jgi:hypothetical protein